MKERDREWNEKEFVKRVCKEKERVKVNKSGGKMRERERER